MDIQIKEIKFQRDSNGKVEYTGNNLEILKEYVFPIIANNPGWTEDTFTLEQLNNNPEPFRHDIDALIEEDINAKVFIAIRDEVPLGALGYILEDFNNLGNKNFSEVIHEMISDKESNYWNRLLDYSFINEDLIDMHFDKLEEFILSKKFYKYISIVVKSELQGKKSGIADILMKTMNNGIILSSSSSPLAVAKRKKLFPHTIYTPILSQEINTFEEFACAVIIGAIFFAKSATNFPEAELGIEVNKAFALRDKDKTMKLARSFVNNKKLSELDYRRLDAILSRRKGQGVLISVS